MIIKPPSWKRTFKFFYRLSAFVSFGVIAQKCGKELQTAEAWGRQPESDECPEGTGKKNPMDCVLRLIALAHGKDAGLAREMAETFVDYVNFLDVKAGADFAAGGGCVLSLLADSIKEHADVASELLKSKTPDFERVYSEIKQSESAAVRLGACVKEEMKKGSEK